MSTSHDETTLKQEAYKLIIFIIELSNPCMNVSRLTPSYTRICEKNYKFLYKI